MLCSCPPGQTGDPLAEGCSPDTRRRPLDGTGGRGGGGGFSFGSRGQSSSGFGGSVSNSGFGGSSNFGGASSSFGGESCNRLSDCQFDRSSILDKPKIILRSVSVGYFHKVCNENTRMKSMRYCSRRQCQGTPGRCVDPCTNNVETGNQHFWTSARLFLRARKEWYIPVLIS